MKKAKRLLLLFSTFIVMLSCCGCFQARQLSERLLVQGIGIDWEDDNFLLTFQIFAPAAEGGGTITSSPKNAKILQSKGSTVSLAVQNATLMQGKELFLGHTRILIIGNTLAKRGITFPLSYFSSNASARHNVNLAVANGKAADILTSKINQGILPSETLEKILENSKENGRLENIQLFEFLASLQNKHESAALPILELKKEETEKVKSDDGGGEKKDEAGQNQDEKVEPIGKVEAIGMAIFKDAAMVGALEGNEAQGLMWLRNSLDQTTIAVQSEDYSTAAVHIFKSSSELIPHYSGENQDNIAFTLKIKCEATLGESMLKPGKEADFETINRLEAKCREFIEKECKEAFKIAITEKKADVFNLGNIVWKDNTKLFKTMRDTWPQELSNIKLDVKPEIIINRMGLRLETE